MHKRLRVLAIAMMLSHPVWAEMSMPKKMSKSNGYRVVVAPVIEKYVPLQLAYIGNMKANNSAAVKARVTGDVMSYHFHEGQYVEEGQLLFTIDPRPYEAILEQAIATLERAKAELAFAREQVSRYNQLVDEEFISIDAYDGYVTQALKLKATVAMDQAAVKLAELNLNYCFIKAPFDGLTSERLIDPGNLVESKGGSADPTLVVVKQMNPIKVIFAVPEADLSMIQQARNAEAVSVQVTTTGSPKRTYTGALWVINNEVDIATSMIIMQGIFENPDEELWPGQFVNVQISIESSGQKLLVPSNAISNGQSGPYVFIADVDSRAEIRLIKIGRNVGNKTIVTHGLSAGEQVVVEGQEVLQSGVSVDVGNK